MSSAASLSLLKGGNKKAAVDNELEKEPTPAPEPETAVSAEDGDEEGVSIDIDEFDNEQLDALVAEHEIVTPPEWSSWDADEKKGWLKSQFEVDDEADQAEAPAEEAKAPAPAPKAEEPKAEEAPVKKPAKKKTTAKAKEPSTVVAKAETAAKPVQGEIVDADQLVDLVHTIENLNEKDARAQVKALIDSTEENFFKLGGVLSVIQTNNWYQPYGSFREYVEGEHGMQYRRAVYWTDIYNRLVEAKVPWSKVKDIGWTKLKEIASVLTTENVDEWVEIAKGQTTLQLIETVKSAKNKNNAPAQLEGGEAKTVTTKTFKVHEGQKATIELALEKAREASNTTVDTVALENICLDYLGGQTLAQRLSSAGLEKALEALDKAFPEVNFAVEMPDAAE